MNIITQNIKLKQSIVKYAIKNGVTTAELEFKVNRRTIYRWIKRYDGSMESLVNKSRRPHTNPRAHTAEEIKLIKDCKRNNKDTGLVVLLVKLRKVGYTRSITSLYRMMVKLNIYKKTPCKKKKYEPKEYHQMTYPGQRVQVDVKYVPMPCLTKELRDMDERYYQYTAIDEYTRMRVIWFAKEHSTYESSIFIDVIIIIIKKFPFKIEEIQTDNGFEFTNKLQYKSNPNRPKTMFEEKLEQEGIRHKIIKPYTPRHNGKVERSHRKDQERFYYKKVFKSFEDLVRRSKYWIREYNNFPMRPLNWLSPNEKYQEYISNLKTL